MAAIEVQRKYYVVVFSNRARTPRRKKLYFKKGTYTKTQVKDIKHELETKYKIGDYDPWAQEVEVESTTDGITLSEALERYITYKAEMDWRESTAHMLKSSLRHFERTLSGLYVEELTAAHITEYVNQSGIGYYTRENRKMSILAFARWLKKQGLSNIDVSNVRIQARKTKKKRIKYLAMQDQEILEHYIYKTIRKQTNFPQRLATWEGIWLIRFLRWQRMSGMRISETMNLRVGSIDWHTWDVTIGHEAFQTKSGPDQTINIGHIPALQRIALSWKRKTCGRPEDRLHWIPEHRVRRLFNSFRDAALPSHKDLKIHALRHSCAIDLCRAGVDIYRVKRWLRHQSISTTMIYADLTSTDVGEEIGRVFSGK